MNVLVIRKLTSVFILLISLCACGGGSGSSSAAPSSTASPGEASTRSAINIPEIDIDAGDKSDPFSINRLMDIRITMPAADFAQLRGEGRTLASTARKCIADFDYTEFTSSVAIDEEVLSDVVVRKKGFLGSLSQQRPSIKLDFNDLVEDRTYQGRKGMTLNNNRQDASNIRQCMAYDIFRAEGIAAPLCNFAKVSVNGEDLGIYTHVEAIKKPFLERTFGDDDGNLYESSIADFGTHLNDLFEKKTNKKEDDRSDLTSVSDALALPDEQLLSSLETLLDVDEFITFWAIETLLGHWDSATGNANNFYIYRNPADNLFHFIPWGADTAFTGPHPLKPGSAPLYRNFNLASRLYKIDSTRTHYLATLERLLKQHWVEQDLLNEIGRIKALTNTPREDFDPILDFIYGVGQQGDSNYKPSQRLTLNNAIAGQAPIATETLLVDEPQDCITPVISSNLAGEIGSRNGVDQGSFSFTLPDGHIVNASLNLAALQTDSLIYSLNTQTQPSVVSLILVGADTNDNFKPYILQVFIESTSYKPGVQSLHGIASSIFLFDLDSSENLRTLGLSDTGSINFSNADQGDVTMSLDVEIEFNAN